MRTDLQLITMVYKRTFWNPFIKVKFRDTICKTTLDMRYRGVIDSGERDRILSLIRIYRSDFDIPNPEGGNWWPPGRRKPRRKYLKFIINDLKTEDGFSQRHLMC